MKYYDPEGNEVSLDKLVKLEPEWAASRIRVMIDDIRAGREAIFSEECVSQCGPYEEDECAKNCELGKWLKRTGWAGNLRSAAGAGGPGGEIDVV